MLNRLWLCMLSTALLSGCSWFDWAEEDEDRAELARRVTAIQSPTTAPDVPQGETMGDRRLRDVYEKQQSLYRRLTTEGDQLSDPENDRVINEVMTEYQSYLADYPESVYGFILYGKMLRDVGRSEDANIAFVKANTLDPNIAVVKQQIGNFLAEEGEPALALAYYMAATELEPSESVYFYQVGELLYTYRSELLATDALNESMLEQQMVEAFAKAHLLDPYNRQLKQRYAESFFDHKRPNWDAALQLWRELAASTNDPFEQQWSKLQETRVLIALGRDSEARQTLQSINDPSLLDAKALLSGQLGA
ncbi:MAG: hypothetical protein AAFX93_15940 [Verrucomicrobiota bacterium]